MISQDKLNRLEHANQLIHIISQHGRQFFYNQYHQRVARLYINHQGKVYFIDDYSGKAIYTHKTGFFNKWKGFSHGGTLRGLVEMMRDYIIKGTQIPFHYIGLERGFTYGNVWGYDDDELKKVQEKAKKLPIISA